MTDFSQLELLYTQFENLSTEINELIQQEDYEMATLKVANRDKLIKKMALVRKTTSMTNEESEKLSLLNEKIRKEQKSLIDSLSTSHRELASELSQAKKKVKVSSAYDVSTQSGTGNLIDTIE